jgi:hypothetical protein
MVERRKIEIKEQAVMTARRALEQHVATLNAEIAPFRVLQAQQDFAGSIKGLRSFASMQDALDATLANGKIAADAAARLIRKNVAAFKSMAEGHEFLFADLGAVISKPAEDFRALVAGRIAQHQVAEAERERKRAAEEAARVAAAEQQAREQEAARVAAQQAEDARVAAMAKQREEQAAAAAVHVAAAAAVVPPIAVPPAPVAAPPAPAPAPRTDEPATLKLGVICERLGFSMTAAFVSETLHIAPAKTDGRAMLFRESQFRSICLHLADHVAAMAERSFEETTA